VLFLRKFGTAMRARAGSAAAMLDMLARLAARLPSQTRRSEESERLQQFSTPVTLGFVAAQAAALTSADVVLEPSAGTGLLAIFAELARVWIGMQKGPRLGGDRHPKGTPLTVGSQWLPMGDLGSREGDVDRGDGCEGTPGLFSAEEADQGDLPRVWAVAQSGAQSDPLGGDRIPL
jgi:hypothetical protein